VQDGAWRENGLNHRAAMIGVGDDDVVLKLKKRWREVGAAASEQRANRHRLIAVGLRLMAVIGGATAKEQAALAKGRLLRLGV